MFVMHPQQSQNKTAMLLSHSAASLPLFGVMQSRRRIHAAVINGGYPLVVSWGILSLVPWVISSTGLEAPASPLLDRRGFSLLWRAHGGTGA
jgi:hypothetical protein